jgi:hypothetical protein
MSRPPKSHDPASGQVPGDGEHRRTDRVQGRVPVSADRSILTFPTVLRRATVPDQPLGLLPERLPRSAELSVYPMAGLWNRRKALGRSHEHWPGPMADALTSTCF